MSDKPFEIKIFDFFTEEKAQAANDSPIKNIALLDTIHREIKDDQLDGLSVSDVTSDFLPGADYKMKEFNASTIIVVFSKVRGSDKTNRQSAVQKVFEIQQEVIRLLTDKPTLNNRGCNVEVLRSSRTAEGVDAEDYAVANIPIMANRINLNRG